MWCQLRYPRTRETWVNINPAVEISMDNIRHIPVILGRKPLSQDFLCEPPPPALLPKSIAAKNRKKKSRDIVREP